MPPRSGGGHSSHRSSGGSFRGGSSRGPSRSSFSSGSRGPSRSSSSRSSFSSGPSRSSFSSGPSRRSSSTHRGSSGSMGGGLFSGRGPSNPFGNGRGPSGSFGNGRGPSNSFGSGRGPVRSNPMMGPAVRRPRNHQPLRYSGIVRPLMYYCMSHDYIYYPESWTDTATGKRYEAGYYDEDGQYYENVVVNEAGKNKTTMKCEYCDTVVNLEWLEGATLCCPNCGAPLNDAVSGMQTDQARGEDASGTNQSSYGNTSYGDDQSYQYDQNGQTYTKKKSFLSNLAPLLILFFGLSLIFRISNFILNRDRDLYDADSYNSYYNNSTDYYQESGDQDSIYVSELGRECEWLGEYYYDSVTDCYFAYYDDGTYQNWQYWYEDISSDYGDYGWMEYDEDDNTWYIETDYGVWEQLPGKYISDRLWHISE